MTRIKLRFSIRDLLWLTLVAALVVGWWIDRARLNTKLQAAIQKDKYKDAVHAVEVFDLKRELETIKKELTTRSSSDQRN
jgi:hypothetical protein